MNVKYDSKCSLTPCSSFLYITALIESDIECKWSVYNIFPSIEKVVKNKVCTAANWKFN